MSKRTMKVDCDVVKEHSRWVSPEIVVSEYKDGEPIKQVKLVIETPWNLQELEIACKKIREYWQKNCEST